MNDNITYDAWVTTEVAQYILRVTKERVEKAKTRDMKELPLRYEMEVIENGISRKLYQYEEYFYRELLRRNGYNLPTEMDLYDAMDQYRRDEGDLVFFNWKTTEEIVANRKKIWIFVGIMIVLISFVVVGQAWLLGLI